MSGFDGALFGRGDEPDQVSVARCVAETTGLQPEDIGVLVHLLLRPMNTPATGKAIAKGMRELGWKMSVDRFEVIAKRLTKAGHLMRKSVYNPDTKRPQWHYWVFHDPAKNPDHAAHTSSPHLESSQVRAENGFFPVPGDQGASEVGENPVSPGQGRIRAFPGFGAEPGKTRFPSEGVSAGQGRNREKPGFAAAPPTPPYREEEESSSLKSSSITGVPAGAQATTDAAAVTAAVEYLAELPGKWACGRKSAGELGPLLAEAVAAQGWELGSDLVQLLTRRVTGRRSALSALRDRIEDLPRYHRARKSLEAERAHAARTETPLLPGAPEAGPTAEGQAPAGAATAAEQPASVSPERVEEARTLLLSLTAPWTPDPQTAARLAPVLATVTAGRGWDLGEALRQQLMSNPGGGQNYAWLLEHKRIAQLPVRAAARTPKQRPAGACERHYWLPAIPDTPCGGCIKDERDRQRETARREEAERKAADEQAAGLDTEDPAVPGQVPGDVTAFVQELAAGAVQEADDTARHGGAHLSDQERRRQAENQERVRRQESRDLAHAHSAGS
ncbi:hypothetical protein ACFWRZ_34270 [Streptomyces rubiginosohelvolus]|uniref:hypothetical protein n=1 Tax=Streptomyces rubiginosohelvolus TaxID=67362 RepID=UPI00365C2415